MKINTLELTNVRGFTYAKLDFQPGFNLIVGINGVGKTTVLESLRIVLSHILTEIKAPLISKESFKKSDININTDQLQVNTNFSIDGSSYDFVYSKSSKDYSVITVDQKKRTNESDVSTREEGITLEDKSVFTPNITRKNKNNILGIFFSIRRSVIVNQAPKAVKSGLFYAAAFIDVLSENRSFNIKMFADWYNVRKTLAKENPENAKHNKVIQLIEEAIYTFLPEFSELDLVEDEITKELTFSIKKGEKKLNFTQLSDGERGVLALVFDIARRLIIANSEAENPLHGEAVILIDELDLHLHPKWQRTIVKDLERTFPKCQFIATTHSPLIIGEVKPQAITIIDKDLINETYKPTVAFGLDSQRILEELLDAPIRNLGIEAKLNEISSLVDEEKYEEAKTKIEILKETLGNNDPELLRINSMIQFLEEDFSDEENS